MGEYGGLLQGGKGGLRGEFQPPKSSDLGGRIPLDALDCLVGVGGRLRLPTGENDKSPELPSLRKERCRGPTCVYHSVV